MDDEVLRAYGKKKLDEYTHWVYVLDCKERFFCNTFSDLQNRAENRLGYEPNWLRPAWEARYQRYIGQTEDLEKRLGQHFKNKLSSDFTDIYEPIGIVLLEPCSSRQRAEYREEKMGKSYYDRDNTYAYWN